MDKLIAQQAIPAGAAVEIDLPTGNVRLARKDIADADILRAVEESCIERDMWSNTAEVAARFPAFPEKVVAAKLSHLLARNLVSGCDCGCRGDWELLQAGRDLAGIESAWRENPEQHYS